MTSNKEQAFHEKYPLLTALISFGLGVLILIFGFDLYQDMLTAEAQGEVFKFKKGLFNLVYSILGSKGSIVLIVGGALSFFYAGILHIKNFFTSKKQ